MPTWKDHTHLGWGFPFSEQGALARCDLTEPPSSHSSQPHGAAALSLQIWDTGGQERFRSTVSTFYKGSDGCLLAFDVTDLESFEALDIWRGDVLAKIIPMEQSYPMVVLGNKIDLADRKVLFSRSTNFVRAPVCQALC